MEESKKAHKPSKKKKEKKDGKHSDGKNVKAFAFNSTKKAEKMFRHKVEVLEKKKHIPIVDRTPIEPPPFVVAVVGPPKVGKTELIKCLVKNFTRQNLTNVLGPVTIVSGKKRRLTFIECNNDVNNMIDIAKVCDLALLLVDASFGFEMETFEFLNICQAHGFPRIMGVLTHLDVFKSKEKLKKAKKTLKHRFWTEIYQGAKLFYLSALTKDGYLKNEVKNLGRFISVMKFRPIQWKTTHPYILVDRVEDMTKEDVVKANPAVDRSITLYGYGRGSSFKQNQAVHIPGVGDFQIKNVSFLPDPCPLPSKERREKRRSLNEKEKLIYAPFSGVLGILYDKDAVYIDIGGSHSFKQTEDPNDNQLASLVKDSSQALDAQISKSDIKLFSTSVDGELQASDSELSSENEDEAEDDCSEIDDNDSQVDEEANDSGVDEEDDDEEPSEDHVRIGRKRVAFEEDEEGVKEAFAFDDSDDEDVKDESNLRWKDNLPEKSSVAFYERQSAKKNVQKLVYGDITELMEQEPKEETYLSDGLLKVSSATKTFDSKMSFAIDSIESTTFRIDAQDWKVDEILESIKDCFVTGEWEEDADAETLLHKYNTAGDDAGDSDEMMDDGEEDEGSDDEHGKEDEDEESKSMNEDDIEKQRKEKKEKLKAAFDNDYDDKGLDKDSAFYNQLKMEAEEQAEFNRSQFEDLPDDQRVQYEGFRPGLYLRMEIEAVPAEFYVNLDPSYPIIVGGLLSGESDVGYVQVRIKKHRWYKRILKTRDPLIYSLGWRRFQTIPIYSIQDHNGRNRLLKYTPEHLHCNATFWGPITPQGSGFIAIQSVSDASPDFRIAATGVVLNLDKSINIVKKLKLIGSPLKIFKKTAFIKGMFNSPLEVAKYEGASLRTVSGIRGQIKRAIKAPSGAFRATFEDKILMSDIVFLRTWFTVDVPQFFLALKNLLLPAEDKAKWQGMKTVGALKRERGIRNEVNKDSLYIEPERKNYQFKGLTVPSALQKELPYNAKPKFIPSAKEKLQRVAVLHEPQEALVHTIMKRVRVAHREKKRKDKQASVKRVLQHRKAMEKVDQRKVAKQREAAKRIMRAMGKAKNKAKK